MGNSSVGLHNFTRCRSALTRIALGAMACLDDLKCEIRSGNGFQLSSCTADGFIGMALSVYYQGALSVACRALSELLVKRRRHKGTLVAAGSAAGISAGRETCSSNTAHSLRLQL
eukprot:scaffold380780_cov34-Prasinocladus_malaysianus.AAC.1